MKRLFWIFWSVELMAAIVWVILEMQSTVLPHNILPFISTLYLVLSLAVYFAFGNELIAACMVMPLAWLFHQPEQLQLQQRQAQFAQVPFYRTLQVQMEELV